MLRALFRGTIFIPLQRHHLSHVCCRFALNERCVPGQQCVCVCVCVMNVGARWMVESEGLDRTRVNKNRKSPPLQPLSARRRACAASGAPVVSPLSLSVSRVTLAGVPLLFVASPIWPAQPTIRRSLYQSASHSVPRGVPVSRTSLDSRFSCRSNRLSNTDSFSSDSILLILLILLAVLAIILIPAARGKPSRATLQLPGREGARARPISGDL